MGILENLTFGSNTPVSQRRLGELVLYIAQKTADRGDFGSTKINKTLYNADFDRFRETGKPITGAQYQRITKGPAPKHILFVEKRLRDEGALDVDTSSMTHKRIALREPDLSLFDKEEIALIDTYIEKFRSVTSVEVSNESHDVRWKVVEDGDLLPYEFSFFDENLTDEDHKRTKVLADEFGW